MSKWNKNDLIKQFNRAKQNGWIAHFSEAVKLHTRGYFDTADLMAIASRETNLDPKWLMKPGDKGQGFGLMQVDKRYFPEWVKTGKWRDAREGILKGAEVLMLKWHDTQDSIGQKRGVKSSKTGKTSYFIGKDVGQGREAQRVTIAAYNAGRWPHYAVSNGKDADAYTTGKNYSMDVLKRAAIFRQLIKDTMIVKKTTTAAKPAPAAMPAPEPIYLDTREDFDFELPEDFEAGAEIQADDEGFEIDPPLEEMPTEAPGTRFPDFDYTEQIQGARDSLEELRQKEAEIKQRARELAEETRQRIEDAAARQKEKFNPETYIQRIPQIGYIKKLFPTLAIGSFISSVISWFAGLPEWFSNSLLILTGFVIGIFAVVLFLYHREVFALVKSAAKANADPDSNNIVLTTDSAAYEQQARALLKR